jgi:hypothetical protein
MVPKARTPDQRVAAVALHGNVTKRQLLDAGLGRGAIGYRVQIGRLYHVHQGVYSLGRPPKLALERAAAAVLACGDGALLSHRAALALWDLGSWPALLDVTAPRDVRHRGIRTHHCTTLRSRDGRRRHGIRVTSLARALLDCAPSMTDRTLTRKVNDALRTPHLNRSQLRELVLRCPTHLASRRLASFAEVTQGAPTDSSFEDDFKVFCERYALPRPETNFRLGRYTVDAYFPEHNLIVELDGWDFHKDRDSFERDRERDAEALARGIASIRITWDRLHNTPDREAERLHRILSL